MDQTRHDDVAVRPFGVEFLEEVVGDHSVSGAQNCHTDWSDLKTVGGMNVDDLDGSSENDPCGGGGS